MRQLTRLIRYVAPYWWQFASSVLLLAGVGFFEAFRLLLVGPVLDRVLNPSSGSEHIRLFTVPGSNHAVYLEKFVPTHFHNAWTIVAYALVASTVLKGIFDYAGTGSNHRMVQLSVKPETEFEFEAGALTEFRYSAAMRKSATSSSASSAALPNSSAPWQADNPRSARPLR